jgi:cytochrome P450
MPNVFDPRVFADGLPHDAFQQLRDTEPVSWQEEHEVLDWPAGPGYWAVTRYSDVRHVLRTPEVFSSWLGATQIRDPEPDDLAFIRRMILNMDPPEHQRLRKIVAAVFTRRRLEQSASEITARASALISAVAAQGSCDLPVDVTDDFPLLNLADLLGVPASDRNLLLRWTNRVIGYQDPEHAAEVVRDAAGKPLNPRSPAMLADMFGYASELFAYKKKNPAEDLMSALVGATVDGRALDSAELQMFFFLVVIAGNDTVRSALPGGVLALAEHPASYQQLRDDLDLLPSAIEEILRWHPPVLSFRRTALQDIVLAGQQIRAGDKVVVYHASAHYDARQFPEPYRFDITRSPNDHIAFGQGPHLCLGAHFGRLQLRIFFREFLTRLPQVELAGPVVRLTSNFINGITHLPISWPH